MSKQSIRVSASRLKTLKTCSMAFYYQEVLRIPSSSHYKTRQGSCLHALLQYLFHPRRRLALQAILTDGFRLSDWPSIQRYIKLYDAKYKIAPYTMETMSDMLRVAFLGVRPHFFDAEGKWSPPPRILVEHKFKFTVGEAVMSGVFDLLLLWDDRAVCLDYKSQGTKFTRAEVPHLIQARIYQLAVQHEFGLIPPVEFIMLRFAPTDRTPDKHIQRVAPASATTLLGLSTYISAMHERLNQFGLAEAYADTCKDQGFCSNVCSYLRPYPYWLVCKPDDPEGDNPVSAHLSLESATQASYTVENAIVLERRHTGCMVRWTQ